MNMLSTSMVMDTLEILSNTHLDIFDDSLGIVILNDHGLILNSNNEATKLLGADTKTLKMQPVTDFIPELTNKSLLPNGKINPYLNFLSRVGHIFELISFDALSRPCLLFFHTIEISGQNELCLLINPVIQNYVPD